MLAACVCPAARMELMTMSNNKKLKEALLDCTILAWCAREVALLLGGRRERQRLLLRFLMRRRRWLLLLVVGEMRSE